MTSIGVEGECAGCDKTFVRGEQMSAVINSNNEPLGWFCDDCIKTWNDKVKETTNGKV